MRAEAGRRAFGVRGAVLASGALVLASCGGDKLGGGSATGANIETVYLIATGGPSGSVTAAVQVYDPNAAERVTCPSPVNAGACQLLSCQLGPLIDRNAGYGNLGPMSAAVDTTTEPLTYGVSGYPTVTFPAPIALGTGGIMKFSGGDGVSVPIFAVSATIPDVGVITEPVNAEGGSGAIVDTTQDLSVSWMPISAGQIQLRIDGNTPTGDVALQIGCTFDGASGSGLVPQRLLSSLKGMVGGSTLYGSLISELETTTVVDGLSIVTQSSQLSPTTDSNFEVFLQ